jgi:hypothetical protein
MTPPVPSIGAVAVKVVELQLGILPGLSILIVGTTSTITVLKIGKKQPSGAVPLTVYVVVTVGVTVIFVLLLPLLQV